MHVPDGILPASVCVAGYAVAAGATWYSLRRIKQREDPRESIPKASLFAGVFFVASLVHIPVPPVSVHLIMNGLLGVVLGWYALPAILVGLFFQAVMFGHGGLTTLGVNAAMMGIPALLAFGVFRLRGFAGLASRMWTGIFGFLGGFFGLTVAAAILFFLLATTIPATLDAGAERAAISALVIAHVPLAVIEGAFTAMVILFLMKVDPRMIETRRKPETSEKNAKLAESSPSP